MCGEPAPGDATQISKIQYLCNAQGIWEEAGKRCDASEDGKCLTKYSDDILFGSCHDALRIYPSSRSISADACLGLDSNKDWYVTPDGFWGVACRSEDKLADLSREPPTIRPVCD